jgi:hypothetical protein
MKSAKLRAITEKNNEQFGRLKSVDKWWVMKNGLTGLSNKKLCEIIELPADASDWKSTGITEEGNINQIATCFSFSSINSVPPSSI